MLELCRTVRVVLKTGCIEAGWYSELDIRCRGEADPTTGYLMNISEIDRAVREAGLPVMQGAMERGSAREPHDVLAQLIPLLQPRLRNALASITWRLTPYHALTMHVDAQDRILISQRFEFSASHRLHSPALSDEQNRAIFGKCNNPNSHGHNYWVQPQVSTSLSTADADRFTAGHLERIVQQTILQRFDHKHLNLDTSEFAGVNPSVENIAKVCYDLLREPIQQAGGRLERVTVWETEKTSCTYPVAG